MNKKCASCGEDLIKRAGNYKYCEKCRSKIPKTKPPKEYYRDIYEKTFKSARKEVGMSRIDK